MRIQLALLSALLLISSANAQSVQQSGSVTPGHAAMWSTTGVIKDAGTATNGNLSTLGVTNNSGAAICVSSDVSTAAGRNQICFSATTNGGTKISSYAFGTAGNPGITFDINGTAQGFPTVALPVVNNDIACFDGITGALKDCGTTPGLIPAPGNAGGIPYYATSTSILSSAILALNGPVIGGGSGGAPSSIAAGTNNQMLFGNTGSAPGFRAIGSADVSPIAPTQAVVDPSSGNLLGSGCITGQEHSLWWVDQNVCGNFNVFQQISSDPSAVFTLALTGSVTIGDAISLTITMGSGSCSGAGCTVTTGAAVGGDTLVTMGQKLACAIANNSSLFHLNGQTCTGGVVTNLGPAGGYANGNPIGYVVVNGAGIALDFNSTISMKVTSSVSGAATEIVTIGNTNCGTRCSYALDNNPALIFGRASGAAPQPGSTIFAAVGTGASTACPTTRCVNYGDISFWVEDSTSGALKASWLLQGPNGGGVWVDDGVYSNYGGSPFSAGSTLNKGVGTFSAGTCFWAGAIKGGYAGDSICNSSGAGQFIITTSGNSIVVSSAAGVGVNVTPTGNTFTSGLGAFISGGQSPTTGTGVSINFTAGAGNIISENFGTSALQPLNIEGSNVQISANGTTSGVLIQAGPDAIRPLTDNDTSAGTSARRWSAIHTMGLTVYGSSSGNAAIVAQAAAGTPTLTLPNASGTFANSASSPLVLSATTGALTCPTCATTAGASIPTIAQGDLLYGSAANTLSALAKDTGTSRFLKNSGTSNSPAWAQPAFTDISGTAQVSQGGTAATTTAGVQALVAGNQIIFTHSVDFNSANTDTSFSITLPTGATRYTVASVRISGASASLTTATAGLFTAAGGAGVAIVTAASAITVSTSADATNNNSMAMSVNNTNTETYTAGTLFFRVANAQGSAATGNVTIAVAPLP